jgi:TP901 family phage tail tape measure protein
MSDVDANIRINIETARAQAQLRALQTQVATLQKTMASTSMANMGMAGAGLAASMPQLKGFNNEIVTMASNTKLLDKSLAGASRGISDSFTTMRQSITKTGTAYDLAVQKANILNRQYKEVGRNLDGMSTVIRSSPIKNMASQTQIATQNLSIFNRALQQGSTSILNWGKNMQWAGRQLMVGFTVPLTIAAGLAAKAFMDLEREVINFKRVYGDFDTPIAETNEMADAVKELSVEMSRLGFTAKETTGLAADAAATGLQGDELLLVTEQATKLATLGMISQDQALSTMISLNSAFKIQGQELEETVNFLNAVENQTVLALSDVTEAIPLVAPVIKGLGGDIEDLAVMLTAMREGGIGANEAANALKTSLARLVTPAKAARDRAEELGINLKAIVEENEGDLMGMINSLARAMEGLSALDTQKLLSDLFGKRQFARMGALFTNITDEASQAQRVIELTASSTEELARLADKELGEIAESSTMRFTSALEQLKVAIAPIGKAVLDMITPILEFGTKIADWFNDLGDNAKKALGILTVGVGVVIPGIVMFIGLMGNLTGILLKGFQTIMNLIPAFRNLGGGAEYLSNEQLEAANAAAQLNAQESTLNGTLNAQASIVSNLIGQYNALATSMRAVPGTAGPTGRAPVKMATGGNVPGSGKGDKVPALLTPGEFVVKKSQADKHRGFLNALNSGSVKGYANGGVVGPETQKVVGRLQEWDIPTSEITEAVQKGTTAGMTDQQVAKSLKQDFGPKASYGRFKNGAPDVQAAHVFPQMQSSAEGVDKAMEELEKGTIKLTKVQETELRNLQQANNVLKKQGLPPIGKAALTSNLTYGGEKMMNQAFANTGLSGKETAASLSRTRNFGMDIIKKQMTETGNLSQKQIVGGSKAMQQALEQQAKKLSKNTVVVDDANSQMAKNLKASGKEVVEFGTIWDRAEKQIAPQHKAFVAEQKALNKQYAQLRIMTTKLTKEQEKALKAAGINAKNIEKRGNNRVAITGAAGTSTSRRGNVESKSLLSSKLGFDRVASDLRRSGAFAMENYATGLKEGTPKAEAQAAKSVKQVHSAAKKADGQASPSKVWAQIGKNSVLGYVNSLKAGQADAKAAGAALPTAAASGAKTTQGGLAASPNQSNQRLAALQNQRVVTTQQAIVADQKVVAASNAQVIAQNRFTTATNIASAAMTKVGAGAATFGRALVRGSGKLSAVTGSMTGLVFAMSMIPGPLQNFAQQILPATFALTAIQQFLPMLANPWVLMVAAVAAVGVGLWKVESDAKKLQQSITDMAIASDGSAAAFRELSAEIGNMRPTEQWNAVLSGVTTEEDQATLTEGQAFLETEAGKSMQERAAQVAGKERAEMLSRELTEAMALNIITPEQAKGVASAMALAFDDAALGQVLVRNIADYTKRNAADVTTAVNEMIGVVEQDVEDIKVTVDFGEKELKEYEYLLAKRAASQRGGGSGFIEDDSGAQVYIENLTEAEEKRLQVLEDSKNTDPYATLNENLGPAINAATKLAEVQALINLEYRRGTIDRESFLAATEQITDNSEKLKSVFTGLSDDAFGPTFMKYFDDAVLSLGVTQEELDKINDQADALQRILEQTGGVAAEEAANLLRFAMAAGSIDAETAGQLPSLMENKQYKGILDQAIVEGDATALAELIKGLTQLEMFPADMQKNILATFDGDWKNPEDVNKWLQEALVNASFFVENPEIQLQVMTQLDSGEMTTEYANQLEEFYNQGVKEIGVAFDVNNLSQLETAYGWYKKVQEADDIKKVLDMTGNWKEVFKAFGITYTQFDALPDLQKAMIIDYVTRYTTIENGAAARETAANSSNPETRRIAENAKRKAAQDQANIISNVNDIVELPDIPDVPDSTEPEGSGGGNSEKNWLEKLLEDTKESKILYGKLVVEEGEKGRAKLGYIQWLRKNTNLTEQAIKELAKDKEAREKFEKMDADERKKYEKKSNNNLFRQERDKVRAKEESNAEKDKVLSEQGAGLITKTIQGNEVLLKLYNGTAKEKQRALDLAEDIVAVEYTQSQQQKEIASQIKQQNDYLLSQMRVAKMVTSMAIERAALGGKTLNDLQVDNNVLNKEAAWIRATQIAPQEELIEGQEDLIDGYEREIDKVQEVIDGYEKEISHKQRKIDLMNREDELRMRESDMLSHDLKLMGYQEEAINDTYNARIEALTKVQQINQNIAKSQQTQLGLADALSRGDIGAAAKAAAQMQAQQADFAAQAFSSSLEASRQSAVDSLTGQDSGLTRDQIDDRQRVLEEESYQNKLAVRAIEDEIYNIREKIYGQEVLIEAQEVLIASANKKILGYQDAIAKIEDGRLSVIEDITAENDKQIAYAEWQIAAGTAEHDKAIGRAEQEFKAVEAINDLEIKGLELQEAQGVQIKQNLDLMNSFGKATARAMKAIKSGEFDPVKYSKQVGKQSVELAKQMASISFDASKYEGMIGPKTTASFNVSQTASPVSSGIMGGIAGNVTNNFMNNSVRVDAAGANANEVADIVIRRLEIDKMKNTGG